MNERSSDRGGLFAQTADVDRQWIVAYCDGGSRGNPGPAGFGVFLQDEQGKVVGELSEYLGRKTNNFAEYSGLLAALAFAIEQGHGRLRVVSDSELMVKQIKGQYRVNSPELKPLYDEAKRRIARLEGFQIQHVLREKNQRADKLANLAMDRGTGRASTVASGSGAGAASGSGPGPGNGAAVKAAGAGSAAPKQPLVRGFVKGGVVHFIEGELPDGCFVRIVREGQS